MRCLDSVDKKVKKLLILNYIATFIVIVTLFYTFFTFKQLYYFIVGIVGLFLMIVSTCFQCYLYRILIISPYSLKIRNFVILLSLMYLGILMLILTITLNHSWSITFVFTIAIQVLYSFISFFAIFKLIRKRPFINQPSENDAEQVSHAYSPGNQNEAGIFVPPEPFSDNELNLSSYQANSNDPVYVTEIGRNLTSGLNYSHSINSNEKNNASVDNMEFYKRTSSVFDDYGVPNNSNRNIDINSTGAVSEYQILYGQTDASDDFNHHACNPYDNMHAESIF